MARQEGRRTTVPSRLSIAYVTRTLPAYRHSVMDELASRDVSLSVIVAGREDDPVAPAQPTHGVSWQYFREPGGRARWRADVMARLASIKPDVILLEHGARLDFSWTILASHGMQAPKVLWTHGIERQERFTGRTSIGSLGRWWQLRLAHGVVCYDENMAQTLRARLRGKIIGFAKNTIDRSEFAIERSALQGVERATHQKSLGLPNRHYLIGLGRLIEEKGFHRLPSIVRMARAERFDVGAIFVGEGPERARIEAACDAAGLQVGRDVFMPGQITEPKQLMRWLFAADLCVNPGCLGLSVVDCAYAGVPVFSVAPGPQGPYHGPEWKYVIEGTTGWLAHTNTDRAVAGIVVDYLKRPKKERESIEAACVAYATANLGVGGMVDGILRTCREVPAHVGS